jgi:peptidoglycan hydrolase-like protein with peptidoglycan-binding domain
MKTSTKIARVVVTLVGTFGLGGFTQKIYAQPTPDRGTIIYQHPSSSGTSVLTVGSTGEAVTQAQRSLQKEGFYKGPINGIFSAEVKSAVIAFQKSEHIKPTGVIDSATRAAMD